MNIADMQWLGDWALILRFGECINAEVLERVQTAVAALTEAQLPGVQDIVPAYASITIALDPNVASRLHAGQLDRDLLSTQIVDIIEKNSAEPFVKVCPAIEIPVRYGGDFGPDLDALAHSAQLDPDEVVRRHCAPEYRVAMLGFAPGFPYLLGLDASLHTPRRAVPRTRVPAGSVAIGGGQTGIYPRDLPGGWHIIGRTGLSLFDVARQPPALLTPGQRVRLVAIAAHTLPPTGPL